MNLGSQVYNMLQRVTGASSNCVNYFKECLLLEKAPVKNIVLEWCQKMSFHITGQFWSLFRIIFLSLLGH